ncbi:MAG: DUF983 domain-containing protein [Bacteroidetes bacterium]|nr:DUF983 domain-containing protein [Bacteroidota bacterium]
MFASLKGKRIYSILNNKCPVCHEGEFYEVRNPYDLKNFSKNYERCSVCNHKFEMETGFFYGAMYVSYALSVAFSVSIFVAIGVLFPQSPYYVYLIAILTGIVVLMPVTYRLSRLVWMNFFYHYEPQKTAAK